MKKIYILLLFILSSAVVFAQKEVSGKVTDAKGTALAGVSIKEKGTTNGQQTTADGLYKIKVKDGAILVFSNVGFATQEITATQNVLNVSLNEKGQNLDNIVFVGTRTAPRSNTLSALPVDVITAKDLNATGQLTFDKALQYKIPSFNTVQTPVNDATSLLDPYEIRNLGPSRTLILINGKRKNMSALLYTQTSPGRGETGADISAIPADAIERVEILRDGASAQYGSDAIAGVMNVILKKNADDGSVTLRSGMTSKGDGEMLGLSLNNGSSVGEKGFINYTIDFSKVNLANRPGMVDAAAEADGNTGFGAPLATVKSFLAKYPDAGNVNGSPETAAAKFLVNGGVNFSEKTQFYYNAAYVYKKVNSFANYRTPYWRTLTDHPYLKDLFGNGTAASYVGYAPTFVGDLNDYNATFGYKNTVNGWISDVSLTAGGNKQTYEVSNTQNRSKDAGGAFIYGANTPISFKPGGTAFNHLVGNVDISKVLSDQISIGFGSEFRTENFEIIAGDEASYIGSGADSFQGNTPKNSGKFNRYNIGGYFDVAYDVTKDFLLNGTVRYENYSDFGGTTVFKLSSRYKFADDKINIRGSYSTGFRAPSLHQIYTEKSQSTFQAGGAIVITGLINNVSTSARINGVPKLTAEKSKNLTFGLGLRPTANFSLTLDYYDIRVDDRIVLGNLIDFGQGGQAFFANAINTKTVGLDMVASYRNIMLGKGKLNLNLSGNQTFSNERVGAVNNPASVTALGVSVIDATQEALLFSSRPQYKYILGADFEIGKWGFSLNNTLFGPTKFKNAGLDDKLRIEFETKVVTDLGINFAASKKLTIAANVNNLLNVLPKWNFKEDKTGGQAIINNATAIKEQENLITFNGRYAQMTYDGFHFSQLGTLFNLSLNLKF